MTQNTKQPSRLSYAHERSNLVGGTPIYGKAPRATQSFETERCPLHAKELADQTKSEAERRKEREAFKAKRRGSHMVKQDRPVPVYKPPPSLAHGADQSAFDTKWSREYSHAKRQHRLAKARSLRDELHGQAANLNQEDQTLDGLNQQAQGGDLQGAIREAFKMQRRLRHQTAKTLSASQAFRHGRDGK